MGLPRRVRHSRNARQFTTRCSTIAAMIAELIETHIAKCWAEFDHEEDRVPHVISTELGTRANIVSIAIVDIGREHGIVLELDDGGSFEIAVRDV